jgi:hypothetical protein
MAGIEDSLTETTARMFVDGRSTSEVAQRLRSIAQENGKPYGSDEEARLTDQISDGLHSGALTTRVIHEGTPQETVIPEYVHPDERR